LSSRLDKHTSPGGRYYGRSARLINPPAHSRFPKPAAQLRDSHPP